MTKQMKWFIPIILIVLALFYLSGFKLGMFDEGSIEADFEADPTIESEDFTSDSVDDESSESEDEEPEDQGSGSFSYTPEELRSLDQMTSVLSEFTAGPHPVREVIDSLTDQGQEPVAVSQSNSDTGEMVTIRTENPPVGTRYFHAQVFKDQVDGDFVQHMSFEFKKGESSLKQVTKSLQQNFPNLPAEPDEKYERFRSWHLDNGYVVWVKKLEASDLENNPFNSYTEDDIGTLRVAVEVEVHEN